VIFSGLDFAVPPGGALILNGPNGSGKSSLLKIIAALLPAHSGLLSVGSEDILGDRDWISRNLCYLAHKNGLKPDMTVAENLTFWASMMYHDSNIGPNINDIAAQVGLAHCRDLAIRFLSSGQARRAALARVLCHPGRIWLLDEPTVGLDANGAALLAGLMNDHLAQGGRILAASHINLGIDPDKSTGLDMADFSPGASRRSVYDRAEDVIC